MEKKTETLKLSDFDLYNNRNAYSIAELEANVDNLSVNYLLNYQILDADFCAKYILNDYCATCNEDTYICNGDVLQKQPHITRSDLSNACIQYKTFVEKI